MNTQSGRLHLVLMCVLSLLPAACAPAIIPTTVIDSRADRTAIGMGLDQRDFDRAASKLVQSMIGTGAVTKPSGGRYVLTITRVTNDTMQRIDTDQLVKPIRVALLNSGKVVVTTALNYNGAEDPMAQKTRELRGSAEVSQANVAGRGQLVAPELSLIGKLMQHNTRLSDGSQRVDYQFDLALTDLKSGLALWEGTEPLSKNGSGETVSW